MIGIGKAVHASFTGWMWRESNEFNTVLMLIYSYLIWKLLLCTHASAANINIQPGKPQPVRTSPLDGIRVSSANPLCRAVPSSHIDIIHWHASYRFPIS